MSGDMLRLISEQRGINKEFDRRKPLTSPTTFFNDSNRPDATTNGGRIIFVRQADGSFQGQFSDGTNWVSFLASATSFDTPAITYGTTAAAGSGIKTLRHNSRILFPNSVMSAANLSTLTLTDDGTDQTLTGNLGLLRVVNSSDEMALPSRIVLGPGTPFPDTAAGFLSRTSTSGSFMRGGLEGGISADESGVTYSTTTFFGGILRCILAGGFGSTYTNVGQICLRLEPDTETYSSQTHTFTQRVGIDMFSHGVALQSGTGVVTTTDYYQFKGAVWPSIGNPGTVTNARTILAPLPTLGATIRRAIHISSGTANLGTEATNVEGIYCEDITRGTSRRVNYLAEGATTGTPTDVYAFFQSSAHVVGINRYGFRATGATTGTPTLCVGFYADGHAVGTTQWAFYAAADESYFSGTQMDDNMKHVLGTGRDAEVYYDGTDFVIDPDVVGTGVLDLRGGLKVDSITNDTGLAAGVYTPTLTNVANLTASTAYECQYMRVGNTVTVSGKVDVDPTITVTLTQLGISLPIASNIGAAEDCSGVAFASGIAGQGAAIIGDAANNRAEMDWIAGDVTNQPMYFSFSYQVI